MSIDLDTIQLTTRLSSYLETLDITELFLLSAQLERLYIIWQNKEGQPDWWNANIILKRTGTSLESPDVSKATVQTLENVGALKILKERERKSHVAFSANQLAQLLYLVRTRAAKIRKESQLITFIPSSYLMNLDGSRASKTSLFYTLRNKKTGEEHYPEKSSNHGAVVRLLHEKYNLGQLIYFDTLAEDLDKTATKHGLESWRNISNAAAKMEAIRQAGIYLQRIANKHLAIKNYMITYNTALIRVR